MDTPHIRPYRPQDLEQTAALWYRSWHAAFPHLGSSRPAKESMEEWSERLGKEIVPRCSIWTAEISGRLAGFMAIHVEEGYIDQLFVDVGEQGRGVGSTLIEKAKSLAPTGLRLHTLIENAPARAFYERRGFCPGAVAMNAFNGRPNIEYRWPA